MANEFTANAELLAWVEEVAALTQAEGVRWCEGTEAEYEELTGELVEGGTFIRLAADVRPDSFLCRSDPADVARVEDRTFICSRTKEEAGPTNNWADAGEMKEKLTALYRGCMRGRTMYVIAYSMGPIGSPVGRMGVEVTDSAYVAVSMHKMARVGREVLKAMGDSADFVRGIHSVGYPLDETQADVPWPCNAAHKYICHFPETREIWSYGSGYGGNALLGKKCHALRIASVQARDEGWLAEHMLILKLTSPAGEAKYIAGAFPSACGKTNLAMLAPSLPGWKVETIGDDIAWMKFRQDGEGRMRLFAINPEAGFFGVAPGTSVQSNPNAMRTISRGTIFTNCALTREGDVWWEGMTGEAPKVLSDWTRRHWTPSVRRRAAHANARFTVGAGQCPVMAREWDDPDGVPISAILFGGRRAGIVPLVTEAFSWQHGVFMGATMASETTAAAGGKVGALRRDPMAMLPFCGYHMGDYFGHWLKLGAEAARGAGAGGVPRIFQVNWFRKDGAGKFIWPGYGENARVLKWIFERCDGRAGARETAIGYVPGDGALDVSGLAVTGEALRTLLEVDVAGWLGEVGSIGEHFAKFGARLPGELKEELSGLEARLFLMQEQG